VEVTDSDKRSSLPQYAVYIHPKEFYDTAPESKNNLKICFITLFLAYRAAKREREREKNIYLEKKVLKSFFFLKMVKENFHC
jgi:hypothetical protein